MKSETELAASAGTGGHLEEEHARLQRLLWFPLAYLIFGVVGGMASIASLVLYYLIPAKWGQPVGQGMIQKLFAFFVWYLQRTGLVRIDFHDLATLRHSRGIIVAANHPSLLDAVMVVSRLPRVFCLMKAGILSNLLLCGTARLAGYVDNHSGKQLVETCTARLRQGDSLVVFPEGTRTADESVNSFKMGFALIARLARAPVQTVVLRADSPFLGKAWPLLKPPQHFPLRYSLSLGRQFVIGSGQDPKQFGREIESYFRRCLRQESGETKREAD